MSAEAIRDAGQFYQMLWATFTAVAAAILLIALAGTVMLWLLARSAPTPTKGPGRTPTPDTKPEPEPEPEPEPAPEPDPLDTAHHTINTLNTQLTTARHEAETTARTNLHLINAIHTTLTITPTLNSTDFQNGVTHTQNTLRQALQPITQDTP